ADLHAAEIIHRDIKPSNVLVDQKTGTIKLTDFGLARTLVDDLSLTGTGDLIGTPRYMSPEQAQVAHELIGKPADIYGIGATLYFLLTGRPPFPAGTTATILDLVRYQLPEAPRQQQPAIPLELETICLKCLSKSPGDRFQTARELAESLSRFLKEDPTPGSQPPAPVPQVASRSRIPRWALATVAMALVAGTLVMVMSLVSTSYWNPTPRERDPLAPINLSHQKPKETFPFISETDRWLVVTNGVLVDTRTAHMLTYGSTQIARYRLQVNVSKNGFGGESGLFFGLRDAGSVDGYPARKGLMVYVSLDATQTELQVLRQEFVLKEFKLKMTGMDTAKRRHTSIPTVLPKRATLEITIERDTLTDIRWNGQVLSELIDERQPARADGDDRPTYVGDFGVYNKEGTTTFSDMSVTPLRVENMPDEHN
ncbi:MAG: protein kinase, partial [Planctomycetes bacterium]|nr:protein kinase [Planctomycetota bacterium]